MLCISKISERLRTLREEAGLLKVDAAESLGISRETLRHWEDGSTSPTVEDLVRICNVYGCDFGYVVGEYDGKTRPATDIHSATGLSFDAIDAIRYRSADYSDDDMKTLAALLWDLGNDTSSLPVIGMISDLCTMDLGPKNRAIEFTYSDGGKTVTDGMSVRDLYNHRFAQLESILRRFVSNRRKVNGLSDYE